MTREEKIRMECKQAFDEGEAQGKAEGKAQGEAIQKKETAQRMKADGLETEFISKYTGLSIEEIEKL